MGKAGVWIDLDVDACQALEREFTARGLPDLPDARFLLGYAIGRLRMSGASRALVRAYVDKVLGQSKGGRPAADACTFMKAKRP